MNVLILSESATPTKSAATRCARHTQGLLLSLALTGCSAGNASPTCPTGETCLLEVRDLGQAARIAHARGLLLARISDTTVANALARCCIPASTGGMRAARATTVVAAACHENAHGGDAKHNTNKAYAHQVNLHAHQRNT
jgi:hypothetical protein